MAVAELSDIPKLVSIWCTYVQRLALGTPSRQSAAVSMPCQCYGWYLTSFEVVTWPRSLMIVLLHRLLQNCICNEGSQQFYGVQALSAAAPLIALWDDHEFVNNVSTLNHAGPA